jgi:membrane protease YdiL (CAAX protease family)
MRWATETLPRKGWLAVLAWLVATTTVIAAIFVDHEWKAHNKDAGISLALVVVLLLLVALAPRGTRQLLRNLRYSSSPASNLSSKLSRINFKRSPT